MKISILRSFTAGAALIALTAAGSTAVVFNGYAADKQTTAETSIDSPTRAELLTILPSDRPIGSVDAPVTIIEYASMSCNHCATFHKETYKDLKKNYIDTGKVRFAFRNFPLNRPAVLGATVAHCAPEGKYHTFVSALFASQTEWLQGDTEQKLKAIALMGGMSEEEYNTCINDKNISESIILKGRFDASKALAIRSTPTFFINGVMHEGAKDYTFFARAIDKQLEKHDSKKTDADLAPAAATDKNAETEEIISNASDAVKEEETTASQPATMTEKIIDKVKATATDIKTTLTNKKPVDDISGSGESISGQATEKAGDVTDTIEASVDDNKAETK